MPATTIISAGFDNCWHENRVAAAEQLRLCGVGVVHRHYPKVPHAFLMLSFLKKRPLKRSIKCARIFDDRSSRRQLHHESQKVMVRSSTELLREENYGCGVVRGSTVRLSPSDFATGSSLTDCAATTNKSPAESLIAEVDLGWGRAFCPWTNLADLTSV